ncbi:ABC transporter permease [Sediminitomix flava]|uniref:Lipopolysaccharide transport system permease protein n=1 Tax=Sediminitomix flava TaxID=379075 RepID=A0A315ZF04_SEDFL|nr:ABC transporter permease [Sediminitomix flava]PWJ43314.1 lipopolysaccharide transport system permease protein [Sediminitomix flava]
MNQELKVTIYSPESAAKHPLKLIREIFNDFIEGRELAWRLFIRNTKAMYRQSILGLTWAFIPPLITALVWIFLNGQKVFKVDAPPVPYPVFVMTGTILWSLFTESLLKPLQIVAASKAMLVKINFPREALLLTGIYEVLFSFLIKTVLLIGVMIWFSVIPTASIFLVPFGVLMLMLLGYSIGVLLTPLGLLYGDVQRALQPLIQFGFYLTPIIYPVNKDGLMGVVTKVNPVVPLLETTRLWLSKGFVSDLDGFYVVSILVFFLAFISIVLYKLAMPHIIERVGS